MRLDAVFNVHFWDKHAPIIGLHALALVEVVVLFLVVRFTANRIIDRVMKSVAGKQDPGKMNAGRVRTLGSLIRSIIFYVLVFICAVMTLQILGMNPAPVLTAAGVVGLAVGFGAQKLVRDIFSGFFIVLEDQYAVGDYVTIGTITGTVADLGMRITEIRDDFGKLVIIPNGEIAQVINHSRGPLQAFVDISVDPGTDIQALRDVIDRIGREVASTVDGIMTAPKASGIVFLDASRMTMRISAEVKTGRQYAVQIALRESLRNALAEAGIQLAYEQASVQVSARNS